jgi:hypothetical protein
MSATVTAGRERGILLLSLSAAPLFFLTLAGVHTATRWDVWTGVLVGASLLACVGVVLIGRGLWKRQVSAARTGVAVLLSLLLSCLALGCCGTYWQSHHTAVLAVQVTDAQTGKPVADAVIRVFTVMNRSGVSEGRTGATGSLRVTHEFASTGTRTPFHREGGIGLWRETLEVEAQGYQPLQEPLESYTGGSWSVFGPPLPRVNLSLTRKRLPQGD